MIKSAAIVDKDGIIYVAKQYCKMTKAEVEALYRTFSRLIPKDAQHTMIYSDKYKYIYRVINEFYCVLVTGKDSNIIDDTKTLSVLTEAIIHYASIGGQVTIDGVERSRFDLLFAFDEIINILGYREVDNMTDLIKIMNMVSEEEKAAQETMLKKEREAKTRAAEKAKELDQKRRNEMLQQMERQQMGRGGFGVSSASAISSSSAITDPVVEPVESKPVEPTRVRSKGRALKLGGSKRN